MCTYCRNVLSIEGTPGFILYDFESWIQLSSLRGTCSPVMTQVVFSLNFFIYSM